MSRNCKRYEIVFVNKMIMSDTCVSIYVSFYLSKRTYYSLYSRVVFTMSSSSTLISSDQFSIVRDSAIQMLSDAFPETPVGDIACYEYLLFHYVFYRDQYNRNEHYLALLQSVSTTIQGKSENQSSKSILPTQHHHHHHHHLKRRRRIQQKHHRSTSMSSDSVLNSSLSDSDVSECDLASAMLVMDGLDNNDDVGNGHSDDDDALYSENNNDDDDNNDNVEENNNSDVEDENECDGDDDDDDNGQVNDNGDIGSDSCTDDGNEDVGVDNNDEDDTVMDRDSGVDDNDDNMQCDDDDDDNDENLDTERDIVMNRSKYVKSYKRDRPKRFYSLYRTLVRMSCCEVSSWSFIQSAIHTRPYHWFHHDIHFASPVFTHAKRKHAQRIQKHLDTDRRFNEPNCFLYQCGKCKCFATKVTKSQTRSADEPETQFVQCVTCQNRWCIK